MAKGRDKHQSYLDALNLLGKSLARRAGRKCELSEMSGRLVIHDLEGSKVEPALAHVILVSESMKSFLDGAPIVEAQLRCLENAVWSTEGAVRRASVQLLSRVEADWAKSAIQNAIMMDESATAQ